MKLIKKIAAIMFAFMMVFTLSSNVNAETITGGDLPENGSITITNAEKDHTYTIYRILALDSYSYEETEENPNKNGNYSYSLIGNDWDKFIRDNSGADGFFTITDDKYVTFNDGKPVKDLAKKAIAYAKDSANNIVYDGYKTKNGEEDVKFDNLKLGYYLIDSSMGALCSLNTTNRDATVFEKNEKPTLDKYVNSYTGFAPNYAGESSLKKNTTNEIGDSLWFTAQITNFKGAENLVFTDIMEKGLSLYLDQNNNFFPQVALVKKNC